MAWNGWYTELIFELGDKASFGIVSLGGAAMYVMDHRSIGWYVVESKMNINKNEINTKHNNKDICHAREQ